MQSVAKFVTKAYPVSGCFDHLSEVRTKGVCVCACVSHHAVLAGQQANRVLGQRWANGYCVAQGIAKGVSAQTQSAWVGGLNDL